MSNILSSLDCGCAILQDGSRSWCPTCSSPVVLPATEEQVAELRDGLAAAQKEANGLREALQFADARHHELRVANEALHLAVREKNYWAWQVVEALVRANYQEEPPKARLKTWARAA